MGTSVTDAAPVGNDLIPTQSTSVAAATAAAITVEQAHFAMARANPRDIERLRQEMLRECRRPTFAAKAEYEIPYGGEKVRGPSIRFAEAAYRAASNIGFSSEVVSDTPRSRTRRLILIDFETNKPFKHDVVVEKTVERRKVTDKHVVLGTRYNTYGDLVYIVQATSDEVLGKEHAAVSKGFRMLMLKFLPPDLVEECIEATRALTSEQIEKDPETVRRRMIDDFERVGVSVDQLVEYLGHPIDHVTKAELAELRGAHAAVESGEASWYAISRERASMRSGSDPTPKADPSVGMSPAAAELLRKRAPEPQPAVSTPSPARAPEPAPSLDGPIDPPEAPRTRLENWSRLTTMHAKAKKGDAFYRTLSEHLAKFKRTKAPELADDELDQAVRACEAATTPKN